MICLNGLPVGGKSGNSKRIERDGPRTGWRIDEMELSGFDEYLLGHWGLSINSTALFRDALVRWRSGPKDSVLELAIPRR